MAHAFGVEFLELELGAEVELEFCKDDFNLHGFHGNALLAKTALHAPVMIRLEAHGHWFRRRARRTASAPAAPSPPPSRPPTGRSMLVSVHLENSADARLSRGGRSRGLIDAIDALAGDTPVIIGGDLNTGLSDDGDFEKETLFAHAYGRGFERHGGPLDQTTTRPSRVSRNPRGTWKLDWFLTRGVEVTVSRIVPSLAPDGEVLSDHDMVVLEVGGLR